MAGLAGSIPTFKGLYLAETGTIRRTSSTTYLTQRRKDAERSLTGALHPDSKSSTSSTLLHGYSKPPQPPKPSSTSPRPFALRIPLRVFRVFRCSQLPHSHPSLLHSLLHSLHPPCASAADFGIIHTSSRKTRSKRCGALAERPGLLQFMRQTP